MRLFPLLLTVSLSVLLLSPACSPKPAPDQTREALVEQESAKLNAWFEARFEDDLARSPITQTYFGMKTAQDRLDDASQLALDESAALQQSWLTDMRSVFDDDRLDPQSLLSYRLYEFSAKDTLSNHAFADHDYVFNPVSGPHSDLLSFMINFHPIESQEDAKAYIARLKAFGGYLGQSAARTKDQADKGIFLPKFAYAELIKASQNIIQGAPFMGAGESPLWTDFRGKIDKLAIEDSVKKALHSEAEAALTEQVKPTYEALIAIFETHEALATNDDGVWKLPRGEAYYAARLKHYTTTNMNAHDIHDIGLAEVARIQEEMRIIMTQVGFDGSLRDFFDYLRNDQKFTYGNNEDGRTTYINETTKIIEQMKNQLDSLFITTPKANIAVKPAELFREASTLGAFYIQPALDGSRPGTYYINLSDMADLPIYQMQALAYHEAIPGHHTQIAISMELEGLPRFRTLGSYTAYTEGWALYAETLPNGLGLYTDPYQDFGRLSMEIFRAARLVVDTGIHAKKWTRAEAVDYMIKNTANSEGDIRAEVDRYIVWPGQATAYTIGMIKIRNLRKNAEERLGDKFNIREFHDVVLLSGPVPLSILEELVEAWVESK